MCMRRPAGWHLGDAHTVWRFERLSDVCFSSLAERLPDIQPAIHSLHHSATATFTRTSLVHPPHLPVPTRQHYHHTTHQQWQQHSIAQSVSPITSCLSLHLASSPLSTNSPTPPPASLPRPSFTLVTVPPWLPQLLLFQLPRMRRWKSAHRVCVPACPTCPSG